MQTIEPFVRWAGGKNWLVPHLQGIIGGLCFGHYYEPFLGGGAVFFSLDCQKRSYLSDANPQLINTYIQVRDNPEGLIDLYLSMENSEKEYYRIRNEFTTEMTIENAARFIYLNQTSFNGLFRVNRQGKYNVPYGFRTKWKHDPDRIRAASKKLRNTNISIGDFEVNKYKISKGDFVFLDPPYTVSHNNNGFIAYNQKLFSLEDQYRLKRFIEYIKRKGAYYLLTNAAHQMVKEIFLSTNDRLIELNRNSLIGGKEAKRALIAEYIFTNIPEVEHE